MLNTIAGGAAARPFITHHNTLDLDMYMRIATQLPLKRLVVGGMERVYEIGRIFRNEGMDPSTTPNHHRRAVPGPYTDFHGMMDIAEGILFGCCRGIMGTSLQWQGETMRPDPRLAPYDHGGGRA